MGNGELVKKASGRQAFALQDGVTKIALHITDLPHLLGEELDNVLSVNKFRMTVRKEEELLIKKWFEQSLCFSCVIIAMPLTKSAFDFQEIR